MKNIPKRNPVGMSSERIAELRRIQQLNFTMIDLGLYLNTHEDCEEALILYGKVQLMHAAAKTKYEECYGPLTIEGVDTEKDGWSWISGPWPWEGEC